ncbi:MAG: sulfotransferase family protein [Acidimicrobiia bacterium]
MTGKVFCIGFHKTGTTSLGLGLQLLGYSVTGPNGVSDPNISQNVYDMAFALVEQYDAFQDNPWPVLYKELDVRYPGSKFILTVRPPDSWIASQVAHFGNRETPMRTWIYGKGCPKGNEMLYVERFEKHNREVLSHFNERPDDFLLMDLTVGDGWQKLCPFLGRALPNVPFPHANTSKDRYRRNQLLRNLVRSAARTRKWRP